MSNQNFYWPSISIHISHNTLHLNGKFLSTKTSWDFKGVFDTIEHNWFCPEFFLSIEHPPVAPSTTVPNPRSKKWSKWKMNTTFTLKTFKIMKLLCLVKKIFSLKKNRTLVFVFFHICNHNPKNRKCCCSYRYEKKTNSSVRFFFKLKSKFSTQIRS